MTTPAILVVDDQPDLRMLTSSVLSRHAYAVDTVGGGRCALERIDAGAHVDLVLLDIQMPDMDGWETLSQIRSRFGERHRVVLCTVKGHPSDLLHGWTLGCDGYIWKPFDIALLVDEVARVLDRPEHDRMRVRQTAIGEANFLLRSSSRA